MEEKERASWEEILDQPLEEAEEAEELEIQSSHDVQRRFERLVKAGREDVQLGALKEITKLKGFQNQMVLKEDVSQYTPEEKRALFDHYIMPALREYGVIVERRKSS